MQSVFDILFSFVQRLILVIVFSVLFCIGSNTAFAVAYVWHTVGSDHFTAGASTLATPIAVASDGTIYVAYTDEVHSQQATVMKYDGSDWSVVGSSYFSAGSARFLSLAVNATGTPYVVYVDGAQGNRATVMKFNGSSWGEVGTAGFSNASIEDTVIAISPDGTPYVTFVDVGNTNAPTTMKYNGSSWVAVGTPYAARAGAPTMAFTSDGTPYVSFSDISFGNPTVIRFNGSSWVQVGDPIAINLYGNAPIAISPNDTPYIAVADVGSDTHIQVLAFNGSAWNQIGSDYVADSVGNFAIGINASGTPYVSLLDLDTAQGTVISYDGVSWDEAGSAAFTSSVQGSTLQLAIGPNGGPYVVYSDAVASDYRLTVQAYFPMVPGQVTGLSYEVPSAESVALSWNALTDTGGSSLLGYRVERESRTGGGFETATTTGASTLAFTDRGIQPGVSLRYRISAVNAIGVGKASQTQSITRTTTQGVPAFTPVVATAMPTTPGGSLMFTVNGGDRCTTNPVVTLDLNADPRTVRGYAASLDPHFAQASILPLDQREFVLPSAPGTYTVYLKYYSTTGHATPVLTQTVTCKESTASGRLSKELLLTSPVSNTPPFQRVLRQGSSGSDVQALQRFLIERGFLPVRDPSTAMTYETGYFGPRTTAALLRFQEALASTILLPNGLTRGTGIFGVATRRAVVDLMSR